MIQRAIRMQIPPAFARMDLIGRMIPVMVGAVEELRAVGADNDLIVRFLRLKAKGK
jgi:hypothetical protein